MLYREADHEKKRELLKILLSNLTVSGKNVSLELRIPFRLVAERGKDSLCSPYRGTCRTTAVAANRHPGQVGYSLNPPQEVGDEESTLRAGSGEEGEGQAAHAAACAARERQRQSDLPLLWSFQGAFLYLEAAL